jgi:predicted RNase H-like nuclease (RuvC/YqgF family)
MHIHQGKLLKEKVDNGKYKVLDLAQIANIPISSLYDLYKKEFLPMKKLEVLCEILGADIREFFPNMSQSNSSSGRKKGRNLAGEGETDYGYRKEVERLTKENQLLTEQVESMKQIIELLNEKVAKQRKK